MITAIDGIIVMSESNLEQMEQSAIAGITSESELMWRVVLRDVETLLHQRLLVQHLWWVKRQAEDPTTSLSEEGAWRQRTRQLLLDIAGNTFSDDRIALRAARSFIELARVNEVDPWGA